MGAFDAVGSILVIALMIAAPILAYLLTDRLGWMFVLSVVIGIVSAISGYWLAWWINTTISGAMAMMAGFFFVLIYLLAPQRGLVATAYRRSRQRWEFAQTMLTAHLFNHEGKAEALDESRVEHLHRHMRWQPVFASRLVRLTEQHGLVRNNNGTLLLTERGRQMAQQAFTGKGNV